MNLLERLPDRARDLIRSGFAASFTSISKAGVPIDTPLLLFPPEDMKTIDFATGLAYPAKAERARRNPKVGLLIEGKSDEPVISIAGMAAVRDLNIEANAIRYISETGEYGASTMQPWEIGHKAVWYWSRIIIEVMPKRVLWWENHAAMDSAPHVLEQPADMVYPVSDPLPPGAGSPAIAWPATPWQEHIQSYLQRSARGQLSLFDADGFTIPISARGVSLTDNVFELDMPKGVPWDGTGIGCLTFEGTATFVGQATRNGSSIRFEVERMIPYMPMVVDGTQVLLPEGKEGLLERLHAELARRKQQVPHIPSVKPEATAGNLRRKARLDRLRQKADIAVE